MSTSFIHSPRRRIGSPVPACLIAALLAASTLVQAQPTGNPKGSAAPAVQGNASKTPATSATPVDAGSGALGADQGPANARLRRSEPPGGGTAGGLTHRPLPATDANAKGTTDKGSAAPRPVPPAIR